MTSVLDASAVIAAINQEPGGAYVASLMQGAAISAVNLAEVGAYLSDHGNDAIVVTQTLGALGLQIFAFDADMAATAIDLRSSTRGRGLSLGDRACLALAIHLEFPAVTADRAWNEVEVGCEIQLIR